MSFFADIMNESENELNENFFEMIKSVCAEAAAFEGIPDSEVSVLFTTDEEIKSLNAEFRDKDAVTDVLSFPANDLEGPLTELLESDFEPETDMESGRIILGDIAVSVPAITRQAEEYGHSFEREAAFLCTHGMLHLMGYDHIDPEEEKIMREKQRQILEGLNIIRD